MKAKYLGMLGLAKRANKLVCGSYSVKNALGTNSSGLVVIDKALSVRVAEDIKRTCREKNVLCIQTHCPGELPALAGRENVKTVCVTDKKMGAAIYKKYLEESELDPKTIDEQT